VSACQEATDSGSRQQEGDDEQGDRQEAAEADRVSEDEVHEFEDDDLAPRS